MGGWLVCFSLLDNRKLVIDNQPAEGEEMRMFDSVLVFVSFLGNESKCKLLKGRHRHKTTAPTRRQTDRGREERKKRERPTGTPSKALVAHVQSGPFLSCGPHERGRNERY